MPATYTYPGVYIEEVPSGVRTITGVSTSDTAFVDWFPRGPMRRVQGDGEAGWEPEAVRVTSMEDFERKFGGIHRDSEASYALTQYFLNGGQVAWVVRVAAGELVAANLELGPAPGDSPQGGSLTVEARSPGTWASEATSSIEVGVDHLTRELPGPRPDPPREFNLAVREIRTIGGRRQVVNSEIHRNLTLEETEPRFARSVLEEDSDLVRVVAIGLNGTAPSPTSRDVEVTDPAVIGDPEQQNGWRTLGVEQDPAPNGGRLPDRAAFQAGFAALEKIAPQIFNLLCIPAAANLQKDQMAAVVADAAAFCRKKRAFLLVDPHEDIDTIDDLRSNLAHVDQLRTNGANSAFYFPRIRIPDLLNEGRPREVGPSGTVAGIYAATDATRGVWKAPAGIDARLAAVDLPLKLTDLEHGEWNRLGINVLRTFPIFGNVVWGARTLDGADAQASEWKYVPVRRTALFIEETLYQATKWAVFEPNDETLWSQLRLNIGAFMQDLFRQGAFQGETPAQAYFVKCDAETTTQTDIDRGVVNVLVGFRPLKPAEFVVIRIQQIAGQAQT
jgi:Bacteriophage tail sheath protein